MPPMSIPVGVGNTPQEALEDLILKMAEADVEWRLS
jgi:hypothetical protein